ncbi:MAG: adenylosuccinate synthase, partial [Armatimonadota bacterium]
MANVVVVGIQWGDEAKGKVVDYLAQQADYVVRYNGGNNAGHTVVVGDEVYKFHTVPVGVINEGVTAVIADGVVLDPQVFMTELTDLRKRGITSDKVKISSNAHVLLPYHRILDKCEEEHKGSMKIGTTGRGIGPCYADKMSRIGIRMSEFIDPDRFKQRLFECVKIKNEIITKVYGGEALDPDVIYTEYSEYAKAMAPYVCNTTDLIFEESRAGKRIVFEGAHGSLLDIDHGTYPYATSSHCVAGGSTIGTGVGPTKIDRVIGVVKAYSTRVGEGPMPTELDNEIGEKIRKQGNEYGTTTGRPRRCGWFDAVAARFSARANGLTCIAVSLLDVLSGFDTLKICTHYIINGEKTEYFPSDYQTLAKAEPYYIELAGWSEDVSKCTCYDDLPENAKKYVQKISELLETPVCMVSVGRRRDQSLIINED